MALSVMLMFNFTPDSFAQDSETDRTHEEQKETEAWDVAKPPGQWRDITIDTTTTTWSFLDLSPDGKTIIFDSLGDIYSVPISGGKAQAITSGIPWNFQPSFNPDGRKIAFISDRDGADNIWVMNADGSNPQQVTKESKHLIHNPAWSPDGEWISARKGFVSRRSISAGEIWLYHANGGHGIPLIERAGSKPSERNRAQKSMGEPAYSRDGKYLYFSQDVTPGVVWQYNKDATGEIFAIKRLNLTNNKVDTLTGGPGGAVRPVPSHDGKTIAFVKRLSNLKSAIYVKDLISGNEKPVYLNLERDNQETAGSHGNTTAFAWTPDDNELIFWSGGKIHRLNIHTGLKTVIPVHITATKKVRKTLRFPVDVAAEEIKIKMLRWAQYSPTSKQVIYQALGHLYTKNINSNTHKRLTKQNTHFEFWPDYSQDGKKIVFTTWNDDTLGDIRIVSAKGGRDKVIVKQPGHYTEPRFSPDGKHVVYSKLTGGYLLSPRWSAEPGIYIVSSKGSTPVKISNEGFNPQFSANGERIIYSQRGDNGLELKSVNLLGNDEKTLANGEKVTEYTVSPDGKWLAYTEQFNVFVTPMIPTGKTLKVTRDMKTTPGAQVSGRAGEFLRWSSDSKRLHWVNGPTLYTRSLNEAFAFLNTARVTTSSDLPEPVTEGLDLSFMVSADKPKGLIALSGAKIVTMRDAQNTTDIIDNGVIIIQDNKILSLGKKTDMAIPANAYVLDVTGKTIIPGLIDTHAHGAMATREITPQQNWMQYSNLAFGVTTIHDPSNDTSEIFAHAELQKTGQVLGPRTYSTGTILYGALLPGYTSEVNNLDEALFHVRRLKEAGAISVKSYNQIGRDSRQQIISAAESLGIMVVPEGGMKFQHNLTQIVDGHTSIEHALPIAHVYDDVKQLWSQTNTGYTPTFGVAYGGISGENYWYDRTEVWKNERLMRYSPKQIIEPRSIRRTHAPDDQYNHFNVAKTAKELRDLNVPVLIGAHGQREGLAAHWEMWMMNQGGFTPWEAIRGATIDAATHLGMDKHIGSIEKGKLADLVIIDGDPTKNMRRSEYVAYTVINGRIYDATTMNEIGSGMRKKRDFFFEKEGGQDLPGETVKAIEQKAQRHHWQH